MIIHRGLLGRHVHLCEPSTEARPQRLMRRPLALRSKGRQQVLDRRDIAPAKRLNPLVWRDAQIAAAHVVVCELLAHFRQYTRGCVERNERLMPAAHAPIRRRERAHILLAVVPPTARPRAAHPLAPLVAAEDIPVGGDQSLPETSMALEIAGGCPAQNTRMPDLVRWPLLEGRDDA